MKPTLRFITDDAIEAGCADLLSQAEKVKSARFEILPRLNSSRLSAVQMRQDCLLTRAANSILIGDKVPVLWGTTGPDGHAARNLHVCKLFATDGNITVDSNNVVTSFPMTAPWGAVSRVWYAKQPGDPRSSIQLYRDWLAKIISPPETDYRCGVSIDNQLAGPGFSRIGDAAVARIPAHLLRDHFKGLPVTVQDSASLNSLYLCTDGVWGGAWHDNPTDIQSAIAPGQEYPQLVGLWYEGQTIDLRKNKPRSRIAMVFGSFQIDYIWPDNLLIAWTTLPDTITSVYNYWGYFPIYVYLNGGTLGEASIAMALQPELKIFLGAAMPFLLDLVGDCTQIMTEQLSDIADIRQRLSSLEAGAKDMKLQIAAIAAHEDVKDDGGGDTSNVAPPTVLAWNLGGPTVGQFVVASGQGGSALKTAAASISVGGVPNAAPAEVYMTGWYCGQNFHFTASNVPPGNYTVLLHGEESWYDGGRLADWTINGVLIPAVDWYKIAGARHKAAVISAQIVVGADGKLVVSGAWKSGDQNVWLNGVELKAR